MFYFARCINIIFNSLLAQPVKYDVHTTRKIKFIGAIFYHIIIVCYRKLGQTSRTAKCQLFELFQETATRLRRTDLLDHCSSYRAAKDAAESFKNAKQSLYRKFRASGYGTWVTKPPEEEMFTVSVATPVSQRSLIPPGSASMSGTGLQPLHTDVSGSASEDFT